jgi:predicted nucleic acid-binding protein
VRLPVRRAQVRELFGGAWTYRHNLTFADAIYVALAFELGGALLTGDRRLASAPTLPVTVLHLSRT